MRCLIQSGHSSAYPPYLTGGGGAQGEAGWTTNLAPMIADRVRNAGVDVVLVGAWLVNGVVVPAPAEALEDYDLFLSLHYDAAIYVVNTGCIVARATLDPMGAEADRFIDIWKVRYPAATGIPLHQERVNPNMTDYYAFRDTSAQTPGVILEHGVGQGDDHDMLFNHISLIAETDAACILEYLGITHPEPAPPPEDDVDCTIYIEALAECNAIKQEFEAVLRDAKYKARMTRAAKKQGLSLPDYLIQKAKQK